MAVHYTYRFMKIHIVIPTFCLMLIRFFSIFFLFCGISKLLWREQLAKFISLRYQSLDIFFTFFKKSHWESEKEIENHRKLPKKLCESNKYKYRSGCKLSSREGQA
jgi:hypothetical protein